MRLTIALVAVLLVLVPGAAAQTGTSLSGTYYWFAKSEGGVVELKAAGSGYVGTLKVKPRYCAYQAGQQIFNIGPYDATTKTFRGTALVPNSIPKRVGWDPSCTLATTAAEWSVSSTGQVGVRWFVGTTSVYVPLLRATSANPPPATPPRTGSGRSVSFTFSGDVEVIRSGGGAEPVTSSTVLRVGDRVVTGMDAKLTFTLPSGNTVLVKELTDLKIEDVSEDSVRTRLWLKAGEVSAEVNPNRAAASDFAVKMPTATASVRGTAFTLYGDPLSRVSIVSVRRGVVAVDPLAPRLPVMRVPARKEVLVGARAMTRLSGLGRAGTVRGINPARARTLVLARMRPVRAACDLEPEAVSVRSTGSAWFVTVAAAAPSTWRVVGTTVSPVNALAKKIAAGCVS